MQTSEPQLRDALLAPIATGILAGLGVAYLTIKLNPHLRESDADTLLVMLELALLYGIAGLALGIAGTAWWGLIRGRVDRSRARQLLGAGALGGLALLPLAYLLLLPGIGPAPGILRWLYFSSSPGRVPALILGALVLVLLGWMLAGALDAVARRFGATARMLALALWTIAAVALVAAGLWILPPVPPAVETVFVPPPSPSPPPAPVVLLCVDGLDLDDVVEPMVAAGELPHFARLMREGTWGPLETIEPTLSAVVWTTLITGKTPADHGIRHFLHFRLPGVERAIYAFPQHTGLNFLLFPLLERLPGMPVLRTPYTSNMRRARALWEIVDERYPVGVYRWLVSWPAEPVDGFYLAGAVGWVRFSPTARTTVRGRLEGNAIHPPALGRELPPPPPAPPEAVLRQRLAAYVGEGEAIDLADPRLQLILESFTSPTAVELPFLIERFAPRFVAAAFYPVDAFHHFYSVERGRGGRLAGAIAERYRYTDARLGELLASLDPDTRLILVSDHGFDFAQGHHANAPAGSFFARGPAFTPGRRVEGLSVYDVAPLVLYLLGMPVPDDMPGSGTGRYREALDPVYLEAYPAARIAGYGPRRTMSHESVESPEDEEIRKALEALGYVD